MSDQRDARKKRIAGTPAAIYLHQCGIDFRRWVPSDSVHSSRFYMCEELDRENISHADE